ncbi:non-specific serine/threonine protein kinase [Malassezia vespertilionis]|uniref:non-specific serine/threonine protein kinase n=1 Tax=Malassezia vespertilionis TaxID=2020962 RepID=UPI0024B0924A|nr:non-specific serine/threonine protein kinase [Malassezia vespertilionis]WFD06169.1 non-specific serine/threonine protein kinase [Malassezia vespertilionis]
MANPRQRRKARSSSHSGATKSERRAQNKRIHRKPSLAGPAVLREQWDKHLTTRQNYAKIGLAPTLGKNSGGLDLKDPYRNVRVSQPAEAPPKKQGMARVVRDEDGNVVDLIEYEEEDENTLTPWGEKLNVGDDAPRDAQLVPRLHPDEEDAPAVKALSKIASDTAPVSRFASFGELSWLAELVYAHGDDVEAMARDRKRNIMQKTKGEIRRALGTSRFLRTTRVKHALGPLVVKTYTKPDPSTHLRGLVRRLRVEREALENVPNVLTYQEVIETEAAGYLIRQWLMCSLYDRISTRPFLSPVEKLWVSYQLLYAMHATHERNVAHGDLKCENVLVTSSLTAFITDFASSFKPTYIPLDDPADFSLFYDTAGRRTCYVAPERFYDSLTELTQHVEQPHDAENASDILTHESQLDMLGLGRPNGAVTEAMDVFSLGCVLAELWRDGEPLFTLGQLFRYRRNEFSLQGMLRDIADPGIRRVIASMVQLAPEDRPSFAALLADASEHVFPSSFSTFLHLYLVDLQRSTITADVPTSQTIAAHDVQMLRANLPDDRIGKLYEDWATIVPFLGAQKAPKVDGGHGALNIAIPGIALDNLAPLLQHTDTYGPAIILLSVLLANTRNARRASMRRAAVEMVMHLAYGWLSDEVCLDRVLPYFVALLQDPDAGCRALALRYITVLLPWIEMVSAANVGLFGEYILPNVRHLASDASVSVRTTYATCLAALMQSAAGFLDREQSVAEDDYDASMEHLQFFAQEQMLVLLTDVSSSVRRGLLVHMLPLATLLGAHRLHSTVIGHLLTYLNDPDWALRAELLPALEALAPLLGADATQRYIDPLFVQALSDEEEHVVQSALLSFTRMFTQRIFGMDMGYEILRHAAGFLVHPNLLLREAAVGLFVEACGGASPSVPWETGYLLARPMMATEMVDWSVASLFASLDTPLHRAILTDVIAALHDSHAAFLSFWLPRANKAWEASQDPRAFVKTHLDTLLRPSTSAHTDMCTADTPEQRNMLQDLEAHGMQLGRDAPKLIALWWYIVRRSKSTMRTCNSAPSTALHGTVQRTVFFTPASKRASLSEFAVRTAKQRIQRMYIRPAPAPVEKRAPVKNLPLGVPCSPASSRPPSIRLPAFLGAQPAKSGATTSLAHVHASRKPAEEVQQPAQPPSPLQSAAFGSTYEGSDPFIHAHLASVLERSSAEKDALGISTNSPSAEEQTPRNKTSNQRPDGAMIAVLTEHTAKITALDVASDQLFFASGAQDKTVRIWDTARLEKNVTSHSRITYTAHDAPITALRLLTGTHCVVSAAQNGSIHAWVVTLNARNSVPQYGRPHILGREALPYGEHVTCMEQLVSGKHPVVALGTNKGRVLIWEVRFMQCLHAWNLASSHGGVTCMTLHSAEHWLCTGTAHGVLTLWDLRFALPLRSWALGTPAAGASIHALATHPTVAHQVLIAYTQQARAPPVLVDLFCLASGHVKHSLGIEVGDVPHSAPNSYTLLATPHAANTAAAAPDAETHARGAVHAMLAKKHGYASTGAQDLAGYVLTGGDDRLLRFWDLGGIEQSRCVGFPGYGEFLFVPADAPTSAPRFVHRIAAAPQQVPLEQHRSPLHAQHAGNARHVFVKAHKDTITALLQLELPFRCIVAGDSTGTLRVWE